MLLQITIGDKVGPRNVENNNLREESRLHSLTCAPSTANDPEDPELRWNECGVERKHEMTRAAFHGKCRTREGKLDPIE
jgi:hypothetical protein